MLNKFDITELSLDEMGVIEEYICNGNCFDCGKYWNDECLDFTPNYIVGIDKQNSISNDDYKTEYYSSYDATPQLSERIKAETRECVCRKMTEEEIKKYCVKKD